MARKRKKKKINNGKNKSEKDDKTEHTSARAARQKQRCATAAQWTWKTLVSNCQLLFGRRAVNTCIYIIIYEGGWAVVCGYPKGFNVTSPCDRPTSIGHRRRLGGKRNVNEFSDGTTPRAFSNLFETLHYCITTHGHVSYYVVRPMMQ
jgi:hypothetical protein